MILVLGGTHQCTWVMDVLNAQKRPYILSVATDYGRLHYGHLAMDIEVGKRDADALIAFMKMKGITTVIDVTHPHASLVKNNAKSACDQMGIAYHGFCRALTLPEDLKGFKVLPSEEKAINYIKEAADTRAILVTGIKAIPLFCASFPLERLYFRVMPSVESLTLCAENGVRPENIIAVKTMPQLLNDALLRAYDIGYFVFKNSGVGSAFDSNYAAVKANPQTKGIILSKEESPQGFFTFENERALKSEILKLL